LFTEVFDAQTAYVPVKAEMDQDFVNNWCNLDGWRGDTKTVELNIEIVSNDEPPGVFHGTECKCYPTADEALEALAVNLRCFVKQELDKKPNSLRRILFWRAGPEVAEDMVLGAFPGFSGYARIGIYQE
jgi:hypothetical protein